MKAKKRSSKVSNGSAIDADAFLKTLDTETEETEETEESDDSIDYDETVDLRIDDPNPPIPSNNTRFVSGWVRGWTRKELEKKLHLWGGCMNWEGGYRLLILVFPTTRTVHHFVGFTSGIRRAEGMREDWGSIFAQKGESEDMVDSRIEISEPLNKRHFPVDILKALANAFFAGISASASGYSPLVIDDGDDDL